jgi:hypothetical protein
MKMKKKFISLAALLAAIVMCLPNAVSAGTTEAVSYLKSQTPDAWITQALIAAGETNVSTNHLTSVTEGGFNPTNDYAKTILALAAAGKDPTTFGKIDYVAKLKTYYNNNQMGDATLLNDDIWSLLAFASIKKVNSAEALAAKNFLLSHQNTDGGWGYDLNGGSNTNDTAAAIMALVESNVSANDAVIAKALVYLKSLQNTDGGFPYNPAWGTDSDSGSDAWIICALRKIGQDPASWTISDADGNTHNPLTNLQSLQDVDGGFWWIAGASEWNNKSMTPYAVVALTDKSYPVGYYEIPQPTRLSVSKSVLNFGERILISVEYFNDQTWLPLAGATVIGLDQDYLTDSLGQVSMVLPSGDYNLSTAKEGFVSAEQLKISVLAPVLAPASIGSAVFNNSTCANVEYDVWQNTCVDNWQYRNVATTTPLNCTLTAEQENQRKKACPAPDEPNNDNASTTVDKINNESAEQQSEVLGVKIEDSLPVQVSQTTIEATFLMNGQIRDFVASGTESTANLGAGERAGVLGSYQTAFGKMPETLTEWEDVIRISNGEMPNEINSVAEEKAKIEFKRIFQREFNAENASDKKIIGMIAYGLRPVVRDLDLERAGIKKFVEIYQYLPSSTTDWDIMRAIAYNA